MLIVRYNHRANARLLLVAKAVQGNLAMQEPHNEAKRAFPFFFVVDDAWHALHIVQSFISRG